MKIIIIIIMFITINLYSKDYIIKCNLNIIQYPYNFGSYTGSVTSTLHITFHVNKSIYNSVYIGEDLSNNKYFIVLDGVGIFKLIVKKKEVIQ